MNQGNIGYQFYRDYFSIKGILTGNVREGDLQQYIRENFTERKLPENGNGEMMPRVDDTTQFRMNTIYPGLLIGVAYKHELHVEGELKLGLFFDFTSGLPVIPGSSIKGTLRSAFPQWKKHNNTSEERKKSKTRFIYELFQGETEDQHFENQYGSIREIVQNIEDEIFEGQVNGKNLPVYDRDIFMDAVIVDSKNEDKRFLGTDAITPHVHEGMSYEESMLKSPNPLMFLKILPGVTFLFRFDLKDHTKDHTDLNGKLLNKEQKLQLFSGIIQHLGLGAKTNVGYGQFVGSEGNPADNQNTHGDSQTQEIIPEWKDINKLKNGHTIMGKVTGNSGGRVSAKAFVKGIDNTRVDFKYASGLPEGSLIEMEIANIEGKKGNRKLTVKFSKRLQ